MSQYDNTNGTIRIFMIVVSIIINALCIIMSQQPFLNLGNWTLLFIPCGIILSAFLIKTTYVSKYAYTFNQDPYPWFAPTFVIAIVGGLILMFTSHFIIAFIYWIIWGIRYENWCEI